ncbi:MAG TPA: helix-turn-helix transcriptional regulator [Mycobacterium sp.]|jgi:transcriptional regulator with XRE-family HTH domain|uniref:helix-turn-helix domain-containing protein n=1 Tax=Mycobacterium sp. TaxID=1785 RepID=UPI002F420B2D
MSTATGSTQHGNIPPLTLGWRMQMALGYAGITVQEMADELEMSRGSLSRWINDKGAPPRRVFLNQWAMRTGVDARWLATGETESRHPEGPDDGSQASVRRQGLEPRTRWLRPAPARERRARDRHLQPAARAA